MDSINTEGVERVGEINIRNYRHLDFLPGAEIAFAAGRVRELESIALWVSQSIAAAGQYDDVRALRNLEILLADRIREAQSKENESA